MSANWRELQSMLLHQCQSKMVHLQGHPRSSLGGLGPRQGQEKFLKSVSQKSSKCRCVGGVAGGAVDALMGTQVPGLG